MYMSSTRLEGRHVLVVEDEIFIAYDIAYSIEEAGGVVEGPVASLSRARVLLADSDCAIDGAILDMNLLDGRAESLVLELHERDIPLVVNTAEPLPLSFQSQLPDVPVFSKPTMPETLTAALHEQMTR
ncbi:MAG: response regulator [Thioclava marina]|jgi:hypothetical protein|uniref:hypothetical protein n=1 Tax=Thioclava TaxID=285107 RepID=UPI0009972294|nr:MULTISPECIES: hypothetical protein [Thioclava]MBC7145623.1 response regulator [Thioclava marina]TNE92789.1 MAG: response regulator [Paracoccaceae bacterium]TNF15926.1 MAG: response regulator [Paracoccaceae bacterium]